MHVRPTSILSVFFLAALLLAATVLANKKPPAQPLDINRASVTELQQVPGVGPSLAQAIVRLREKSGPFKRVEDLLVIRGISHKRLTLMRPYLKVEPSMRPKAK